MSTPTIVPTVLRDLLEELIGGKEYHELRTTSVAQTISLVDPEEKFCHIEWPNKDNPIPAPRLYRKAEWIICAERQARIREEAEKFRQIHGEHNEGVAFIRQQLIELFNLNVNNKVHAEHLHRLVAKALKSRAVGLSKVLGKDLMSIPESPYGKVRRVK
jgi:hypothetical protein